MSSKMIKMKSNEYWGRRSGYVHKDGTLALTGKRASINRVNHSGGVGKRRKRFYVGRCGDKLKKGKKNICPPYLNARNRRKAGQTVIGYLTSA